MSGTDGYRRLQRREKEIGRRATDDDFRAFLLSEDLARERAALRRTLDEWKKADLDSAARRILAYLPPEARVRATVFPVVKPRKNSFVFEPATNPAIFLAVDPSLTRDQFENMVAHELHHIGFASLPAGDAAHSPEVEKVLPWVGAFGEGFAMLAAAGGPDVHPHERSPAADRERWDRDVARFDQDLGSLQAFFLDVLEGRLATEEAIREKGLAFFGEQGAFYTVGWRMAVLVEKRFGRAILVEGMRHPARLLATYNPVAEERRARGEGIATWSPEFLRRLGAEPIPVAPGSRPASGSR
ncbi:MAG: hypothetical protein L0323_06635 [Planctomycetes bacterium]|nr:hypothetical protein [Planctomycetota bacterium]